MLRNAEERYLCLTDLSRKFEYSKRSKMSVRQSEDGWKTGRRKAYSLTRLGVFVRSDEQLERAQEAVRRAGLPVRVLDERVETTSYYVSISTMHLVKGLEFRAVAVMACDDEVIPLQERIESVADDADLEGVYDTERHLLYVACTGVRNQLLVTSVQLGSELLDDLRA